MLRYVSDYVLAAWMKHLAADWTKSRVVGGREDGGPDLADDSVNGVIISGPLSVQYKQEVTHQAKLLSSFLSPPTSVTFTHLPVFVFWGGGADLRSVWEKVVCVGASVSTAVTHKPFWRPCPGLWEKCPLLFFSSYANLIIFPNPCLLFVATLFMWHLVTCRFSHKAIISGHFLILGEQGIYCYCFIVFMTIHLCVLIFYNKVIIR